MARRAMTSLRNEDFTDRELLHILNDVSDASGWATTDDLHEAIRIGWPGDPEASEATRHAHARRCIASRFTWMVRPKFGWVERNHEKTKWRVTRTGRDLMNGKLTKALERSLKGLSHGDRVLVMRELGTAYNRAGDPARTMLRREWTHDISRSNGRR